MRPTNVDNVVWRDVSQPCQSKWPEAAIHFPGNTFVNVRHALAGAGHARVEAGGGKGETWVRKRGRPAVRLQEE